MVNGLQLNLELLLTPVVGVAPLRSEGTSVIAVRVYVAEVELELLVVVTIEDVVEECLAVWPILVLPPVLLPVPLLSPDCVGLLEGVLEKLVVAIVDDSSRLFHLFAHAILIQRHTSRTATSFDRAGATIVLFGTV